MQPITIVVGVIIGVLAIGGAALLSNGDYDGRGGDAASSTPAATAPAQQQGAGAQSQQQPSQAQQDEERDAFLLGLAKRDPKDPAAVGDVDAPVVMIEWADYRCPYCSLFNEQVLPELQRHVDEGTLRIEFRDFATFGDESVYAAVAARAAGHQGKQVEFMDALFAALPNEGHPPVDEAVVTEVAKQVGVPDMARFTAELADQDLRNAVEADTYRASQIGISSVPAFVVNTQYLAGAQPAETFTTVIEAELAKANS